MDQENGTETHDDPRIMRFERANNANQPFELGEAEEPCVAFMSTNTNMEAKRECCSSTTKQGFSPQHGGTEVNSQPHPIILVEGLDGVGKSTLVDTLATKLNAALVCSPPKIPDPIVDNSDLRVRMDKKGPCTRREYYRCGNFHASMLIEEARKNRPVVLDRYWPSTASFALLDDPPPRWEPIGTWPNGLVVPDIMILLTVSEETRLKRMKNRGLAITEEEARLNEGKKFREHVLRALRSFDPIEIDTSLLGPDEVLHEVMFWLRQAEILPKLEYEEDDSAIQEASMSRACVQEGRVNNEPAFFRP
jgi:thymidylate kinase